MAFLLLFFLISSSIVNASNNTFNPYSSKCPDVMTIIEGHVRNVVYEEPRMAASLLNLFFHDCFVNGCDASVLLDDTAEMMGENSVRSGGRYQGCIGGGVCGKPCHVQTS
ncbi:peroxidase P7-like [Pyrus ussuriensis x Pyrus communis]|uniref:peroxidase n=1 Tax=Pyrus ussuriensis x Pyrus communis TaxID=2448454 RepID=A0A5N5H5B9_9ROSA|nr:peroxidase P7-like [Pyrus ussuriensis x Pyrus communis]